MTTRTLTRTRRRTPAAPVYSGLNYTSERISAYLESVRPFDRRDLSGDARYQEGRRLIERMATVTLSMGYSKPASQLTAAECASVLYFVRESEPLKPRTWWQEREDRPSHLVGFDIVLEAVQHSLEGAPMEVRQ